MSAKRNILRLMRDERLLGPWFGNKPSWKPWEHFLACFFGLTAEIDGEAEAFFRECTGRTKLCAEPYKEAWLLVGRRGGKTIISALIGVYIAAFFDYRKYLAPGERATVMLIAGDRRQARNLMRFVKGFINNVPMLAAMMENDTAESVDLNNRTTIEVCVSNPKATRGYTLAAVICDEIATWPTDEFSPNRDVETLTALRPALLTIPHSRLICITSPYARKGAVWEAYRKHWGQDESRVLVWQAPTLIMNPSADRGEIDKAFVDDYEAAKAEYGAQFRSDIAALLTREAVDAVTLRGVREIAPAPGVHYIGSFDAASGAGSDSITCAVAHFDQKEGYAVLDAMREIKPPFSPEGAVSEFATLFKNYRVTRVIADKWAAGFTNESLARHGLVLEAAEKAKSDFYLELLPAINSGRVRLLDDARLEQQLLGLERRTARSGKDSVDHSPNGHDDLANAVAIAVVSAKGRRPMVISEEALQQSMRGPQRQRIGEREAAIAARAFNRRYYGF